MKCKALLWSIAAALLCATLAAFLPRSSVRQLGLTFVGFTNASGGPEALFWFTNRDDPKFSWHTTLNRRTETGWVEQAQTSESRYTPQGSQGKPLRGFEDLDLIGIPVINTNDHYRVVIEATEPLPFRQRIFILLAEWQASRRAGQPIKYSHDRYIFATGETVISQQPVR
jgi:hypothetical protein